MFINILNMCFYFPPPLKYMLYSVLQGISDDSYSAVGYDSRPPKEKDEGLSYGDRELSIRIGRGVSHKGKHPMLSYTTHDHPPIVGLCQTPVPRSSPVTSSRLVP